jgi:hypothetical protein
MVDYQENRDLATALVDLNIIEKELSGLAQAYGPTADVQKRLEEWLEKLQNLVKRFKPKSYTISANIPWGVSVAFTWEPAD